MTTASKAPRAALGIAAIGIVSALAGGVLLATPATAATDDTIFGSTSLVLDFSTPGELGLEVSTQNLSSVPAYGVMYIQIPSGDRFDFGPKLYAPGESRTFYATL